MWRSVPPCGSGEPMNPVGSGRTFAFLLVMSALLMVMMMVSAIKNSMSEIEENADDHLSQICKESKGWFLWESFGCCVCLFDHFDNSIVMMKDVRNKIHRF